MARSIAEAQQELDRLNTMHRSLPNQRDEAAVKIATRIRKIEQEIVALSAAPVRKSGTSGFSVSTVLVVVLIVGVGAFLAGYFGLAMG